MSLRIGRKMKIDSTAGVLGEGLINGGKIIFEKNSKSQTLLYSVSLNLNYLTLFHVYVSYPSSTKVVL